MIRLVVSALIALFVFGLALPSHADAQAATALVDKAIKAMGGEDALMKVKAASWKTKGTLSFNGNDNEVTTAVTIQGIDHFRQELDGEFGGNKVHGVTALAGDKGFRSFGDNRTDLEKEAIANQKRTVYLQVIPVTLLALKDKEFKLDTIADDKVGDRAVAGISVTAPDKKEFKLYFDKETGLPAKLVAKVVGFRGPDEFTQETTFSEYKDMAGIKKATKVVSTRNGGKYMDQTVSDFKVLEKVDPKVFTDAL